MKIVPQKNNPKPPVKLHAATATRRMSARHFEEEPVGDDEFEPSMTLSRAFVIVLVMHVVAVGGIFAFNAVKTHRLNSGQNSESVAVVEKNKPEEGDSSANTAAKTKGSAICTIPASRRHVVRTGDTPYKLAQVYGVKVEDLLAVNYMKEGSVIVVGQELKIPDSADMPSLQPVSNPGKAPGTAKPNTGHPTAAVDQDVKNLIGTNDALKNATKGTPAHAGGKSVYTVVKGDNPYSIAKKMGVDYAAMLKVNGIDDPKKLQIGQQLVIPPKENK